MGVKVEDNTARNQVEMENKIAITTRLLLEGIYSRSTPVTPMRPAPIGGTLRAEVLRQVEGTKGIIEWRAPYAKVQERGYSRDKAKPFMSYSTPGTGPHFARDAVIATMKELPVYARLGGLMQ